MQLVGKMLESLLVDAEGNFSTKDTLDIEDVISGAEQTYHRIGDLLEEERLIESLDREFACALQFVPTAEVAKQESRGDAGAKGAERSAGKPGRRAGGGKTVNDRLRDLLDKNPEAASWSAKALATALGCSKGSVGATQVWKDIQKLRELEKLKRLEEANP